MSVVEYHDDDRGYLEWVARNASGYVINISRALNPDTARLHKPSCRTITGEPARGSTWTREYIKLCSPSTRELDDWAERHVGTRVRRCAICQP
jgi:hypothetical protein